MAFLCTCLLILTMGSVDAAAKNKEFHDVLEEIHALITKSPSDKIACDDICQILKTDELVEGQPMRDYLPFCEKKCPGLIGEVMAKGEDLDVDFLAEFIMDRLDHDEL